VFEENTQQWFRWETLRVSEDNGVNLPADARGKEIVDVAQILCRGKDLLM
jgi:hypothetical protein